MLAIDHVILVAEDVDATAALLLERHGLASLPGGRHTGHGTFNRIIPLGGTYLEVMGVADESEASGSPMGRWAMEQRTESLRPAAVCLRTDGIDGIAAALGETPIAMERIRGDGVRLGWRLAGFEGMIGPQRHPFFIQWEIEPGDHPGDGSAQHRTVPGGISAVRIGPVSEDLEPLLAELAELTLEPGSPGVHSASIRTSSGDCWLPMAPT